jgi:hypothetical protein
MPGGSRRANRRPHLGGVSARALCPGIASSAKLACDGMSMVHGLQTKIAVRSLLAKENIVIVGFALTLRGVATAVVDPRVKDDQPTDVLWIDQPFEPFALTAPPFAGLASSNVGWSRSGNSPRKIPEPTCRRIACRSLTTRLGTTGTAGGVGLQSR